MTVPRAGEPSVAGLDSVVRPDQPERRDGTGDIEQQACTHAEQAEHNPDDTHVMSSRL
jgi:hypothetical protein